MVQKEEKSKNVNKVSTAAKKKCVAKKSTRADNKLEKPHRVKVPKVKGALSKEQIKDLLNFIVQKLDDGKAQEIVTLDLEGKTSFADFLIVASGTSARHVFGLANNLAQDLKKAGYRVQLSGENGEGNWILLDAIDIVVHLFTPQTRSEYDIEGIWKK